ncbi:hypothetical protein [Mycolicibacterium sp. HK-90]|uniref:hypothetical protein n=1 Tax=Mycolicibacterium sp. HK-90 TaxID=3056937 RepID=UPI00265A2541|nr:hypothetical protein [Mycolicibacterium sp. HK-90]WKG04745.1 hypothetical protein QU592_06520 [Mycolicibacterium sp. HK-90]
MRKPNRTPTAAELVALTVALIVGFGVAAYFGNVIAGIAVALAIAIIGSGFFYART